jgi:stress-induced morphogen
MKKKTWFLGLVLGVMVNAGSFAQGYPVIDITAIVAAIQNGFTMVENLQAMYPNIKTMYDQLQRQIISFETFDINKLDADDPLGSWKSLETYANRMKVYEQNIDAIINKKDIKIGKDSFSLGDIFISPNKAMQTLLKDEMTSVLDPLELKLTAQEKKTFQLKFGKSFGNNLRINQLGAMMKKKAAEVVGYATSLQKNVNEDRERLEAISKDMQGSESIIQQQQVNNAVLTIMAQDTKTQAQLMGDIAHQLAINASQEQAKKDAEQEEINMNDLEVSEGYRLLLDAMEPSTSYR